MRAPQYSYLIPQVQEHTFVLETAAEDDAFKIQVVSAYKLRNETSAGKAVVPGRNPLQESAACSVRGYAACRTDAFLDALGTAAASAQVCLKPLPYMAGKQLHYRV